MKSISDYQLPSALVSPPSRGAWIEIMVLPPSVDREFASPPARGGWVVIAKVPIGVGVPGVAPLAGGVD